MTHFVEFETKLKHNFKDKSLIKDALTHPSYEKSRFEILEFIGDRVVSLIVAELLWSEKPENEKAYASRFVSLTNKEALFQVAKLMSLEQYLLWRGEESHINTILSDSAEAVMGALYLDAGLEATKAVIKDFWDKISTKALEDPKTILHNYATRHGFTINYKIIQETGRPHKKNYVIELEMNKAKVTGQGLSIKEAEKDAADKFLKRGLK